MNDESARLLMIAVNNVANSITPIGIEGTRDQCGNYIVSHTEAMLSISDSLQAIAHAISDLACAVVEKDVSAGGLSEIADAINEFANKQTTNQ